MLREPDWEDLLSSFSISLKSLTMEIRPAAKERTPGDATAIREKKPPGIVRQAGMTNQLIVTTTIHTIPIKVKTVMYLRISLAF